VNRGASSQSAGERAAVGFSDSNLRKANKRFAVIQGVEPHRAHRANTLRGTAILGFEVESPPVQPVFAILTIGAA
jgi:hypothetical protein